MSAQIAAYGTWKSPITTDLIVSAVVGLGEMAVDGGDIYWVESRPQEKGRCAIVKLKADDGTVEGLTPPPYSARNRVHEYGGGVFAVGGGEVFFTNDGDNRIYRIARNGSLVAVSPVDEERRYRYADLQIDRFHDRLICVREEHFSDDREPKNTLVAIRLDGSNTVNVLVDVADFYASPRLSWDGRYLAWLSWSHPNMPWDGTNLEIAELLGVDRLASPRVIAGGKDNVIFQPEWHKDGSLYFIDDRTGWGNLYRWQPQTDAPQESPVKAMLTVEAEFGTPQWVFGLRTYALIGDDRAICTYSQGGISHLVLLSLKTGEFTELDVPHTEMSYILADEKYAFFGGASPRLGKEIVKFDWQQEKVLVIKKSSEVIIDAGYISQPETIAFPTTDSHIAYAFYYPPTNRDFTAPTGELPPLLVKCHGGPTAAASSQLSWRVQYWTSRGFGYLDVNYGGSTGFGKEYQRRLDGNWGIVDVDDCANGARYLVAQNKADGARLAISGGSAGGYTVLSALTFRDVFTAGASYYGIGDLAALARDTHKFESRYTDRLVAPYPAAEKTTYAERSPINFVEKLSCPVIFFHGLQDRVVPPNQAEMMFCALKGKGIPTAYVPFSDEQHGFRQSETISRALNGEFYFYSRIFKFTPAESLKAIDIVNL
jgi:dipeptidyl aminopeptidase/acylaminoacyl peptidase